MHHNAKDITGQRFGRLIAKRPAYRNKRGEWYWECLCDCGGTATARVSELTGGRKRSCGCLYRETRKIGGTIHGFGRSKLQRVRSSMFERCYNPNNKNYHNYGGRGIIICDEWRNDYSIFYNWAVSTGYKEGLSIDRINNDGPYSPKNCRWTTPSVQSNNKRNTQKYNYKGEELSLPQISKLMGISASSLRSRIIDYGWSEEKAFSTPAKKKLEIPLITFNGVTRDALEWGKIMNLDRRTIRKRILKGLSVEEILAPTIYSIKKIVARESDEG